MERHGYTKNSYSENKQNKRAHFFMFLNMKIKNFKLDCPSDGNFKDTCALSYQNK